MPKKLFLVFIAVIGLLASATLMFVQSRSFARMVKKAAVRYLPADLGIDGDFQEFAIQAFPPGISIVKPKLALREKNLVDLPAGARIEADQIDLRFRPFQVFSGTVWVSEVRILRGQVEMPLEKSKASPKKKNSSPWSWDDLFKIKVEAISTEETEIRLSQRGSPFLSFRTDLLRLSKPTSKEEYLVQGELSRPEGEWLRKMGVPVQVERLKVQANIQESGVQLDSLDLDLVGAKFHAQGKIKGDLLNQKDLLLDLQVRTEADLSSLVQASSFKSLELSGKSRFDGKLKTRLDRFVQDLQMSGALELDQVSYQGWKADHVSAQAEWNAQSSGGELSVTKAVIESAHRSRKGGFQSASGGKLEVQAFKYQVASTSAVSIPLHFHQAHVHWLAGTDHLKAVYPLDFRVDGSANVQIFPGADAKVQSRVNLSLKNFEFDNQRLGKEKPLRRILHAPELQIEGEVSADASGLRPNLEIRLPHSKIRATGKIDSKKGYDLSGTGIVDLADLGEIAENPVRGQGKADIRVRGPAKQLLADFDLDLKDAFYLKFNFGDLKGRITWDDAPDRLLFSNCQANRGLTRYFVNGQIELGANESIGLDLKLPQGSMQDFFEVVDPVISDLWWFPRAISGKMSATAQFRGGLKLNDMKIRGEIQGTDWEYFGERFQSARLVGGFDRGKYSITEISAKKRIGTLRGELSFDSISSKVDWSVKTQDFRLDDFDRVALLDIPLRGRFDLQSRGSGKGAEVESDTQIRLEDLTLRGAAMPPSRLSMQSSGGVLKLAGTAQGDQGRLNAHYELNPGKPSSVQLELNRLDFSPFLHLLNPKLAQDPELTGRVSGAVALKFKSGEIEYSSGSIKLSQYRLAKTLYRLDLNSPVELSLKEGSFDPVTLSFRDREGEFRLRLRGRHAALEGDLLGSADVGIAEFFTSVVQRSGGQADLRLSISGSVKAPVFSGRVALDSVALRIPSIDSALENLTGSVVVKQGLLQLQNIQGDLSTGRVSANGEILLHADRAPEINVLAKLNGNRIKVFPFQFVKVRGDLNVAGKSIPYLVSGNLMIDQALSREKIMRQKQGDTLKAVQYLPPRRPELERSESLFQLGIQTQADRGIIVQNDLFDAELRGKLQILNTIEAPRLFGTIEMVQGKLLFKDRAFQVQSAKVDFDNPAVLNPVFNLSAWTDVNGTKVQLYAAGRVDRWKIDLTSNPVLPESEILSLLALGYTSSDGRRIRAGNRSVMEQGEAASLLLHSLDFNRDVENRTGLQIELDESLNTQSANSVFRRQSLNDTGASPKIVIKRRLGKRVDVSYGSTVGVGSNTQRQVNAEVKVTPAFSVIGVWDNYEGVDIKDSRTSYGVDFKLQKRFK